MEHLVFITLYHVMLLHLTALLRFFLAISMEDSRLKKEGSKFSFKNYMSDQWDNWALHYVAMWSMMFILPNIIEAIGQFVPMLSSMKGVKDSTSLTSIGTFAIGFGGFDAVKMVWDKIKNKDDKTPEAKP